MSSKRLQTPLPISRPLPSAWKRLTTALSRRLRVLLRLRRLYMLRAALRFAPTEAQLLFALTVAIGVACGFAAVAFHLSIEAVEHYLIEPAMVAPGDSWMVWTLVVPTLGGLLCGVLLEKVVPNARGSGIPQVKLAFAREGRVRLRDAVGKFFIGSLQIGSGASLGREGPTVQICAGIASRLGKLLRISPKSQRRLLPVGVAAGIAAAFNAPIAAVTFTIEEVVGNLDQAVLSGVIVAAALAAVIERSILGEGSVFEVPTSYGLSHASSLLIYALIGLGAALASWVFSESLLRLRVWFRDSCSLPRWARPGLGGLVTGMLAVAALKFLGSKGITGGGYATLGQALTGQLGVRVMVALTVLKLAATVFSYSSGGAGGIFAPSLFIGGMLGGAIGSLDTTLLHHEDASGGAFALVGMGAVFAGVIRAPITSVLIIVEMTRGYSLILPLMIANMTAYVIAHRLRPQTIYEALLEQDGVVLRAGERRDVLERSRVEQSTDFSSSWRALPPAERAAQISLLAQSNPHQHVYPVIDAERRVLGLITPDELAILHSEPDLLPLANALDLMRLPVTVRRDDTLRAAFDAMLSHGIREVPVTDPEGRFVGIISESAIASAYARDRQEQESVEGAPARRSGAPGAS